MIKPEEKCKASGKQTINNKYIPIYQLFISTPKYAIFM